MLCIFSGRRRYSRKIFNGIIFACAKIRESFPSQMIWCIRYIYITHYYIWLYYIYDNYILLPNLFVTHCRGAISIFVGLPLLMLHKEKVFLAFTSMCCYDMFSFTHLHQFVNACLYQWRRKLLKLGAI